MKTFFLKTNFFSKFLPFLANLSFLLPFSYFWRWPITNLGSINALDLFLLIFILLSLFLIFQKPFFPIFQTFCQKNFWAMFFSGLFVFFSFFSALSNPALWDGLGLWKSLFCLPIIFTWLVIFWIKNGFIKSFNLLMSFWFSALGLTFLTIIFWQKEIWTYDQRLRLFFSSPNQLALNLSLAIFIGINYFIFFQKKKKKKFSFLFLLGTGMLIWTLYQTHSLGAELFIPLTFLFWFLFYRFQSFLFFFLVFFNLFLLLNWNFLLNKLSYQPNIPPNSTDSRIVIWQVTRKIISEKGFWGIGLGNFQKTYLAYQPLFPPYPQWAVPHAHNLIFQLWSEVGFLPLLFFFFLLYFAFTPQKTTTTLEKFLLVYFLLYGLVETPLWKNDTALLFWLILFLILSQNNFKQTARKPI